MKSLSPTVLILALVTAGVFGSNFAVAQDFMNNRLPSLFADKRAFYVGDIVTILLMEFSSGSNQATTDSDFEHKVNMSNAPTGAFDFLPDLGLESALESEQKAKGRTSRQGSLKGKVSARVTEVLPNGMLRLEGQRSILVNGEEQVTILMGLVRPKDITAENTVYSYLIADAQISYEGKGTVDNASSPGILSRFIAWLF